MAKSKGSPTSLKARLVLTAYAQPATPIEVARRLRLPANTVHYWTRKLEAEGLLEHVATDGRSRSYLAREEALAGDPRSVVPFAKHLMDGLSKLVLNAAERMVLDGAHDTTRLGQIDVHELRLRASDVPAVMVVLKEALAERIVDLPQGEGEMFTLALMAVPGRLSEHA